MADTQFEILVGNYGSGKTEIALNLALDAAAAGQNVALVDIDIVNPYFRSSAQRKLLEEAGVTVIASPFANGPIDLPLVPAEVSRIFTGAFDYAVVDVGGDPVGAAALGRYKNEFLKAAERTQTNYIINASRPQTTNLADIRAMFELIEARARLKMKWLINNTNLAAETNAEILLGGQELVEEVSSALGVPVRWITAKKSVLDEFCRLVGQSGRDIQGEPREITTRMRLEWFDF